MSRVILITGGVRSGKSRFALEVASRWKRKAFLATAEPLDEEMAERISRHRKERGREFFTVEEPLEVCRALLAIPDEFDCVLFECLATWLGNVLVREGVEALEGRSEELLRTVEGLRKNLIIVTNEVGMGIVPPAFETRRYAEVLGTLNGELARRAGEVYLVVSGIPLMLKGGEK